VPVDGITAYVKNLLSEIQDSLYSKALAFRDQSTVKVDDYNSFKEILDKKGGFILAHWDGTSETEGKIKEETKATIRCIPINNEQEEGKCIYSGKPSKQRVIFAKAY
jgi:prolyl-tRNA synthetase